MPDAFSAVDSAADLVRDPIGHYWRGRSIVAWVHSPALIGAFHLGPLDLADHTALVDLFPLPTSPLLADRYDLMHDVGSVAELDQRAFEFFEQFLVMFVDRIAARVKKLAVVRPSGLAGAAFAGIFAKWIPSRFDAKLCSSREEAYAFLEIAARAELDALHDACTHTPILRQLRDALAKNPSDTNLDRVAAALGMSSRSLQRYLTTNNTSFRQELVHARIRTAETLLLETDEKIETIATRLGFRSSAAFTTMFRQITGEPPSHFRSKRMDAIAGSRI